MSALLFWSALAAVVLLSLTPVAHLPPQAFDVWDKAQHALGFAVLAFLGGAAYPARLSLVWVGLLLLGAAIELAQSATGWRQGDVLDGLADAVGVSVGALGWLSVRRCLKTG
jgi:VanZ family protein